MPAWDHHWPAAFCIGKLVNGMAFQRYELDIICCALRTLVLSVDTHEVEALPSDGNGATPNAKRFISILWHNARETEADHNLASLQAIT